MNLSSFGLQIQHLQLQQATNGDGKLCCRCLFVQLYVGSDPKWKWIGQESNGDLKCVSAFYRWSIPMSKNDWCDSCK